MTNESPLPEGNVVSGYSSGSILMLDVDLKPIKEVMQFAKKYTKFHDLGSVLIMRTSKSSQIDLIKKKLGSYCIVFGAGTLHWKEVKWHIKEAYRLGIVKKDFLSMREIEKITERVNAKNNTTPHPEIVFYLKKNPDEGVKRFLRFWAICKNLGFGDDTLTYLKEWKTKNSKSTQSKLPKYFVKK